VNEPALKLEDMLATMPSFGIGAVPLQSIISENEKLLRELVPFDPLRLAATFSGLLTVPELQSNCIRLEILVHLALALGGGRRKPTDKIVARLFSKMGDGIAGRQEDPAEDVFVSLIATPRGNFRVLEGVWETAGFYLQRIVDALERIPAAPRYDQIRDCVYALLRLSDLVCERTGLVRHQLGNTNPEPVLPKKLADAARTLQRRAQFTSAELAAHGISVDHLAAFAFLAEDRSGLAGESIGHSTLERYPVAHRNGEFFFLLPTATSAAIRRFVIEEMDSLALRNTFVRTLAEEYARLFSGTPLLGKHSGAPIKFRRTVNGVLAGVMMPADCGLYVNFVFFVDTLEGFETDGLIGLSPNPTALTGDVDQWIEEAYAAARKDPEFREMLTLLVGCGVGRGIANFVSSKEREHWRLEFVSAADLLTLSWLPDFSALSLWRILEGQDKLKGLGVELQNINGLLNMVAWARSLGGHLVPHGQLPESFGQGDVPNFIMIEQNALRAVRHEALVTWDTHAVPDMDGKWTTVRKVEQSLFAEDRNQPYYATVERGISQWPRGIYESSGRAWWCELETPEGNSGHWAYQWSMTLKTWLCRAVPVLEPALPCLPTGPLRLLVRFEGRMLEDTKGERKQLSFEDAKSAITATADAAARTVSLVVGDAFEKALWHPENIAERALVEAIVEGFDALAGKSLSSAEQANLVRSIVPDASARQSHAFVTRSFRDYVRDSIPRSPILLDADDGALNKLGLGWRVRDRSLGGDIRGKDACTSFLNDVVRLLEDELCVDLRTFDREAVICWLLKNHESAIRDRDNWSRTAAAVLSLHNDKEATLQGMAMHDAKLNAVFQATRLLVEFAICECPLQGGRKPRRLDMCCLMAKVMSIAGLGGWSDAIRWEAMEPTVRVTPLGDIHANLTFHEQVLARYGRAGSDVRVQDSVESYAENLVEREGKSMDLSAFPAEFWEAWQEEFGASFEETRKFIDFVENLGLKAERAVLKLPKSTLLDARLDGEPIAPRAVTALVEVLTFKSRARWRDVPLGYDEKDRQPWRFRRRLSLLRKPLVQIDDAVDPTMIIAPGILRDAFAYMFGTFHRGDYPPWQLRPKMKRWAGISREQIGKEFSAEVAKRLNELGWQTETEVKITKLLRKGFPRNYGDVDVLAWNPATGRVLVIECKDVQYRKTDGEIAEQLADFRGELGSDGKPDLLRRHLDRVELISQHVPEVTRYIGFDRAPRIESHLVFKNPVPMQFAWKRMAKRVELHILADLHKI
jgi:hypothetical protein